MNRIKFDQAVDATKAAMLGDPVHAAQFARDAEIAAATWPPGRARDVGVATAQWLEGEAAFRANDSATAEPLINAALATVVRQAPGSKLNADLLLSHARIEVERGKPQNGLSDLQYAYRLFAKLHDARSEAKALQSIGSIYQDAQDFNRVVYYYKLANEIYSSDPMLRLSASNNMANAYAQLEKIDEAESEFRRALVIAQQLRSMLLSARILDNIADLQIIAHHYSLAQASITQGISLAADPKAASWLPMLLGTQARLDLAVRRPSAAVQHLEQAFRLSERTMTDQSYRSLHLTGYRAYKAVGDYSRALDHLEIFRKMDDEGRTLAASTSAALLAARFDFANQNVRIATLKTGQLERDVALTRVKARQSTITLGTLLALAMTVTIFLFVYLRALKISRNNIVAANLNLEKTNSDLADALSAKSQFLATTSHEIRTPLNGILGMTQVMLADHAMTGTQRERISLVDAAGRSMRSLVDDILDFAKMDAGMLNIESAAVDLATVLPDLVGLWRLQAIDKHIALALSIDQIDHPVMTDLGRFRQIIFNLLANAIKFTPEGSIRIHAYTKLDESVKTLVIDFHDTGVGIPEVAFEAIFEPFRQLDTSTTRRFGGTGLGLAISRHLARALGGDITVTSIVGGGSTFHLRLPYVRADITEPKAETTVSTVSVDNSRKVTIVSPNPITRSLLRSALTPYFTNCRACDVKEIEALTSSDRLGIVLLDIETLLADVLRLDALVAQLCTGVGALALLSPAGTADHLVLAWKATGVADIIFKPVSAEVLADRLTALITTESAGNLVGEELRMA